MTPKESSRIAGELMSIPMAISSLLFPVVGYFVDKQGHRIRLLTISAVVAVMTHFLFGFMYPVVPLILLGVSYGIFGAVLWPTVVFLVPEDKLVTS